MTKSQVALILFIRVNGRLPTVDEAVDMYALDAMRKESVCVHTRHGLKTKEFRYKQLREKALLWLKYAIGSLVVKGSLKVVVDNTNRAESSKGRK